MTFSSIVIPDVKLTEKEYTSLNFQVMYSNKSIKLLMFVVVPVIILMGTLQGFFNKGFNVPQLVVLFIPLYLLIGLPIRIIVASKKQLASNPWLNQPLDYEITPTQVRVQGNGILTETSWSNIQSVQELKRWYVIYTDRRQGFFLPKNRFTAEQEAGFREIVGALTGRVKVNLK